MFKYPKTLLFVCALISALLITSTSAHYYNLNTGQWQYTSGRQGNYGNRPYTYYPQQPRQQQNPYPNIQIAKADWVCKNAAGDMVILTEDDSAPRQKPNNNVNVGRIPEPTHNNNNNNGNNNNNQNQDYPPLDFDPQNTKNPFLPDFSKLPPIKQPPIDPPQTEKSTGEGLIDIRFGA